MLDLVVVRLELLEPERPVLDRRAGRDAAGAVAARRLAHDLEVPRIQPPALRPVVQRRAADAVHHRMDRGARRLSGDAAFGRCAGISRLAFCAACGQPRKLLRSSSGAKSRGVSRVPASRPMTLRPACASGSDRDAAGGAEADDDDVGRVEPSRHGARPPSSACVELRVVVGRRVLAAQRRSRGAAARP